MDRLICEICKNDYLHLGSHIWHRHRIKANKYKEMFGLPHNTPLINEDIKKKKSNHWQKNKEKYLKNFLPAGKKFAFKKGKTQIRGYISAQQKRKNCETIAKFNDNRKSEKCPVCHIIYDNLCSHLYNSHHLIMVKE